MVFLFFSLEPSFRLTRCFAVWPIRIFGSSDSVGFSIFLFLSHFLLGTVAKSSFWSSKGSSLFIVLLASSASRKISARFFLKFVFFRILQVSDAGAQFEVAVQQQAEMFVSRERFVIFAKRAR